MTNFGGSTLDATLRIHLLMCTATAALMVVFCVLRFHEVPELWHERMTLVNETLQEKQAVGKIDHL